MTGWGGLSGMSNVMISKRCQDVKKLSIICHCHITKPTAPIPCHMLPHPATCPHPLPHVTTPFPCNIPTALVTCPTPCHKRPSPATCPHPTSCKTAGNYTPNYAKKIHFVYWIFLGIHTAVFWETTDCCPHWGGHLQSNFINISANINHRNKKLIYL